MKSFNEASDLDKNIEKFDKFQKQFKQALFAADKAWRSLRDADVPDAIKKDVFKLEKQAIDMLDNLNTFKRKHRLR